MSLYVPCRMQTFPVEGQRLLCVDGISATKGATAQVPSN